MSRHFETQRRGLVVTDKYIYRLDPEKKFKLKKNPIPIGDLKLARITDQRDQLVVFNLSNFDTDLVFYIDSFDKSHDRVAELLANIYRAVLK
jgi:hypothetical protein